MKYQPIRVNEELYALLSEHAKADGRSLQDELELVVALFFSDIDVETPLTTKKLNPSWRFFLKGPRDGR